MNIEENLNNIKKEINIAEEKSGRKAGSVKLLAVSKFHPQESVIEAIKAGHFLFGENRVQEANSKFPQIKEEYKNISLHLIGSLQSNKVNKAVEIADCIESIDRCELLPKIENQCCKLNKNIKIFFEIHTGEESKSGFTDKGQLIKCLDSLANNEYPHIIPQGFMTMAPFTQDEKLIRKSFISLRELSEDMQKNYSHLKLDELSMGMSGDYKIAIEEGSTIVRIGTAIFGERNYN
ncbi:MAG: YggS family pyridoxal phosphate-dependent enzyme [Treponema sp.]|nr:YggS family pyridoxal phosphate-dependent enzyme [Treponema sp.]